MNGYKRWYKMKKVKENKIYLCEWCRDTGYAGPTNVGTKEEPEIVFSECDLCDAPLNYEAFIKTLSESEQRMMKI